MGSREIKILGARIELKGILAIIRGNWVVFFFYILVCSFIALKVEKIIKTLRQSEKGFLI